MEFTSRIENGSSVVSLSGRLDAVTSPVCEQKFRDLVGSGVLGIVVDFGELEYISSAGLRSILAAAKKLKALQGQIKFCNLSGMVKEVFNISGFTSMFSSYATLDEALAP